MNVNIFKRIELSLFFLNLFIYISFLLYLSTYSISYQDGWILDGIFLQVIVIAIIFFGSVLSFSDIRYIVLLCAAFTVFLNLIAPFKYHFFVDTYDSAVHYFHIRHLFDFGSPVENSPYSRVPGFHIFIVTFLYLSGCSINFGVKYLLPVASLVYPLLVYAAVNRFEIPNKIKIYTIICSTLLVVPFYMIYGTTFASIIFFLLFTLFLMDRANKWSFKLLILIAIFSITVSHGVTSFLLSVFLLGSPCYIKILKINKKYSTVDFNNTFLNSKKFSLLVLVVVLGWWMFQASFLFDLFVKTFYEQILMDSPSLKEPIPPRFFEIDILSRMKIFSIYHSKDFILMLNSIVGLLALIKLSKSNHISKNTLYNYMFILSIVFIVFALISFSFILNFGSLEYRRYIHYGVLFAPFFTGIAFAIYEKLLNRYFSKYTSKLTILLILFSVFAISLVQFYPCQPIVPTSNSINTSSNEPIMHFHSVNSQYRVDAIKYAEKHISTDKLLITDKSTRKQLQVFSNESFYKHNVAMNHPFYQFENQDNSDLLLLHDVGISGIYMEPVEYRTTVAINEFKTRFNLVYSNGGYFLLRK